MRPRSGRKEIVMSEEPSMKQGKVKWYDLRKGYGFISREDDSDLFVHYSHLNGIKIKQGDLVEYKEGTGKTGPCATNIKPIWRT